MTGSGPVDGGSNPPGAIIWEDSMEDLKKQGKKYFWEPVVGEEYPLGYHHGRVVGIGMIGQQEVHATYFGLLDGVWVFFREKQGKIQRYTADPTTPAYWIGEDDGPSFPHVASSFAGELEKNTEIAFVKAQLADHACKRKLRAGIENEEMNGRRPLENIVQF